MRTRWVLQSGRVMPELPEAAADAALELVEDLLGSRALPAEERREVVERVSLEMMREFKIKEAGR